MQATSMASRKLLSMSRGLFHRLTSVRNNLPVVSRIPAQKAGIFLSQVKQFTSDASNASADKTDVDDGDRINSGYIPRVGPSQEWIVVFDFQQQISEKDMEDAFVEKVALVFKCSHEDAKQKICKLETKKYWGFHIVISEEMARKFVEYPEVFGLR
ncbi:hypothetical protein POM88_045953 [Heracleum sosnowskyi]|uniref:MORF/ORRM1/DAG-like MORF domain-containing protein n=1 Tax=Heracleum sosnowskyi TaxID=360622 RepID=A0AAD8H6N5_9APIA|nr:hypothetical protein POM88_045953 [Heracleum sosnowskyi]